ncbi:MAG: acylphosphatase [Pseudomonadota bacterium]
MSDRECRLFTVSGRVQGVFFRASTARQAATLKLTGYAINLEDGDVEVLACGTVDALDQLEAWLAHGPPAANVVDVRVTQRDVEVREGFLTG